MLPGLAGRTYSRAFSNLIFFRAGYNNSETSAAEFSMLSAVAKEIFSTQAISAQSEQDFSRADLFVQI